MRKIVREAFGKWIVSIDISDIFRESEDEYLEENEAAFKNQRDRIVTCLRAS